VFAAVGTIRQPVPRIVNMRAMNPAIVDAAGVPERNGRHLQHGV
jgi:hypothetical protein